MKRIAISAVSAAVLGGMSLGQVVAAPDNLATL